jgi:hypothetical protein
LAVAAKGFQVTFQPGSSTAADELAPKQTNVIPLHTLFTAVRRREHKHCNYHAKTNSVNNTGSICIQHCPSPAPTCGAVVAKQSRMQTDPWLQRCSRVYWPPMWQRRAKPHAANCAVPAATASQRHAQPAPIEVAAKTLNPDPREPCVYLFCRN